MNVDDTICDAMRQEGVTDPESKGGIDFCINKCPYPKCIIFETTKQAATYEFRKDFAARLYKHQMSVRDIALIMGKTKETVRRYLGLKR